MPSVATILARKPRRARLNNNVFVNCPFDEDYRTCLEAIVFAIEMANYDVRCALEEHDGGDIRLDKLCRMIAQCDRSIHDLSRVELNENSLPRFNMPFELGLVIGAKRFGSERQRSKSAVIMVSEPYRLPIYLSDLGGNDPLAHRGNASSIVRIVRDSLHRYPSGQPLPGATHLTKILRQFYSDLPRLARAARLTMEEVHPFRGYRNFLVPRYFTWVA